MNEVVIRSCSSDDCAWPWYEYDIDPLTLELTISTCRGLRHHPEAIEPSAAKERALEGTWELTFDPLAPKEVHVLAVALDGTLDFVPSSKQRPVYAAHLAEVDPTKAGAERLVLVRRFVQAPELMRP